MAAITMRDASTTIRVPAKKANARAGLLR